MTTRLVAMAVAALVALAACAPIGWAQPPAFPDGSSEHTISVGGLDRTYRVYRPAGLPVGAPLVVMLHGGFGSAQMAENRYGWDELADSARFAVAYPDALGRAWNTGGGCCGRSAAAGVDDVGFITAVVDAVRAAVGSDPARIYATGMSNGGIMSYTLACRTDIFAAIGPNSATQLGTCTSPKPLSVLQIHGTADRNIPYGGGPGAGVAHIDGPSAPDLDAFWRGVDECGPPAVSAEGQLTTSTAACPGGRGVALITVDGGGHDWPAFATGRFWEFFAAHPR